MDLARDHGYSQHVGMFRLVCTMRLSARIQATTRVIFSQLAACKTLEIWAALSR